MELFLFQANGFTVHNAIYFRPYIPAYSCNKKKQTTLRHQNHKNVSHNENTLTLVWPMVQYSIALKPFRSTPLYVYCFSEVTEWLLQGDWPCRFVFYLIMLKQDSFLCILPIQYRSIYTDLIHSIPNSMVNHFDIDSINLLVFLMVVWWRNCTLFNIPYDVE